MDGPLDGEMAFALAYAGTQIASGIGILSAITGMGAVGYVMIEAHTRPFVFYGVLVDEATQWDIYGYEI
jgi:hypothetical protein